MKRFLFAWIGPLVGLGLWMSVAAQEVQEKIDFDYGEKLAGDGLYELAALQFDQFAEKYPNSPKTVQARFIRAECLFSLSRWSDASNSYLLLFIQHPDAPMLDRAQFRISECFERMGRISDAVESYNRVTGFFKQSPLVPESLYRSGRLSLENGNPEKAESTLRLLLDAMPDSEYRARAVFLLVDLWSGRGEDEKSLAALRPIVTRPTSEEELAQARFRMGNAYESLGQWSDAMSEYRYCADNEVSGTWKQKGRFRLGCLLEKEARDVEAEELYRSAVQPGLDSLVSVRSLERLGELLLFRGEHQPSLDVFREMESLATEPLDRQQALFRQGQCFQAMGQTGDAVRLFRAVIEDSCKDASLCKKAWLSLGSAGHSLGAPDLALSAFQEFLERFPGDSLASAARLEKARILIEQPGTWDEAASSLRSIETKDPAGLFKADARFLLARGLERNGRIDEAVQSYRSVVELDPGTDAAQRAQRALDSLDFSVPRRSGSRMAVVIESLIDAKNSAETDYQAGLLFFDELKEYRSAVRFFNRFLEKQNGSALADSALYRAGQSYEKLAVLENNSALLDSGRMAFRRILAQDPTGNLADNAAWRLAATEPQRSDSGTYRSFSLLLVRYPDSDVKDRWLDALGKSAIALDSATQAVRFSCQLIDAFPQSLWTEDAYLRWGTALVRLNRIQEADSVFSLYARRHPNGRFLPQTAFVRAKQALDSSGGRETLDDLQRVWVRFADSPWSDSAGFCLGQTFARQNRFQEAISVYKRFLAKDSLVQVLVETGLAQRRTSLRKRVLWEIARAYERSGDKVRAKSVYQTYLSEYRSMQDRIPALLAISRLAEEDGRPEQAIDFLNRIMAESPSDSIAEAIGLLRFRVEKYEQAITDFEKALVLESSESGKAFVSSRIIIALLRQGKVPQADVRIAVFAKTYKSDPLFAKHMAEFCYEKGLAYFRMKEFEPALKSFQEVVQKYRGSPLVADAEFETGRIHLVTNRVEQALKILTDLPNQYPNHPIRFKVYYNLGDHYYRSQQFNNAITAFQTAMEDSIHEDIAAGAMRYLVRVYDALRMWDSALLMIRRYLERFPDADDVLQKRVQLATITMKLEDYSRAIEILQDVQPDADPETEAEIQYWIGKCHFSMGHFETAAFEFLKVKYLSKSTRLPWDKTALYEAGLSFMRLREFAKAKDLFEKIIEQEGATSDWGRVARQRIQEMASGMTGAG